MFNESESLITLSRAFHNPVESGKNDLLNLSVLQGKSVKLTADLSVNPDLCCEVAGSKSVKYLGTKLFTILTKKCNLKNCFFAKCQTDIQFSSRNRLTRMT